MAHREQQAFVDFVRKKHKHKFRNCSVLDIGSLDINGNNRRFFKRSKYIGIDLSAGKNVDIVSKGHEFTWHEQFDVVITTECLEHDVFYEKTLKNAFRLTRGILIITCASTGRPEHGTIRTTPYNSPFTTDHYKNLTIREVDNVLNASKNFSEYYYEYNAKTCDLYFYGVKRNYTSKEIYKGLCENQILKG
jgi:hypothetical protein